MEYITKMEIINNLQDQIRFHNEEMRRNKNILAAFSDVNKKKSIKSQVLEIASELFLQKHSEILLGQTA
jgi:hypothetical protein